MVNFFRSLLLLAQELGLPASNVVGWGIIIFFGYKEWNKRRNGNGKSATTKDISIPCPSNKECEDRRGELHQRIDDIIKTEGARYSEQNKVLGEIQGEVKGIASNVNLLIKKGLNGRTN